MDPPCFVHRWCVCVEFSRDIRFLSVRTIWRNGQTQADITSNNNLPIAWTIGGKGNVEEADVGGVVLLVIVRFQFIGYNIWKKSFLRRFFYAYVEPGGEDNTWLLFQPKILSQPLILLSSSSLQCLWVVKIASWCISGLLRVIQNVQYCMRQLHQKQKL